MNLPDEFVLSREVAEALQTKKPMVALESSLIAQGLPFPHNVETALNLEVIVRKSGAIPVTIAVLDGRIHAGLTSDDMTLLGDRKTPILKLSRKDLPYALAMKKHGATTVASTMICAKLLGIRVFGTGGIGGVHRGGEDTLDISADLQELAQTDVAVVCAGAKAILDIGRTLEVLETLGVPVLGYQTNAFPAFYSRESGYDVDHRVDSARDVAHVLQKKWSLGMKGGVLIANPPPQDQAIDRVQIEEHIQRALRQAAAQHITGAKVTPFLLREVAVLSEGRSMATNIALLKSNAAVAAAIAVALVTEM